MSAQISQPVCLPGRLQCLRQSERRREGDRERWQTEGEINKLQNNKKKSKRIRAMLKNKNKSKRSHQNELNDMKTNTRTHCCQGEEEVVKRGGTTTCRYNEWAARVNKADACSNIGNIQLNRTTAKGRMRNELCCVAMTRLEPRPAAAANPCLLFYL